MPIYKQTTEITNIDDLLSSVERDIEEVYFGDKQVFTVWGEYDGVLSATYSANGSMLADYRIYGSAGGVGDRTVNILDMDDVENGYWGSNTTGWSLTAAPNYRSTKTAVSAGTYILWFSRPVNVVRIKVGTTWIYDGNTQAPELQNITSLIVNSNADTDIGISARRTKSPTTPWGDALISLTPGSTAPAEYVPYGYVVPMSVSDGTTLTTTPIYIGSSPLGEDEYVDYGEGKVYRRTENIFNGQIEQGYYAFADGQKDGTSVIAKKWVCTTLIACNGNTDYGIRAELSNGLSSRSYGVVWFDSGQRFISSNSFSTLTNPVVFDVISPSSAKYLVINIAGTTTDMVMRPSNINNITIAEDSAAPSEYIPYYDSQDPPVPLPALPTVDGTNIVDYAGQSAAPSRFYAKYRKKHT